MHHCSRFAYTRNMELLIGFSIGIIIALAVGRRKKSKHAETDEERKQKQQTDEEIVTVILPVIDSNK